MEKLATPDPLSGHRLWEPDGADAWAVHDWTDYQPTNAELEARHIERAQAGKRGAEGRWHRTSHGSGHSSSHPSGHGNGDSSGGGKPMARSSVPPPPYPIPGNDVRPAGVDPPPAPDGTDEVHTVHQILGLPVTDLTRLAVAHAIETMPDTDPVLVAIDYQLYRTETRKEQRRQPLEGFQLAMKSGTERGMFRRERPADTVPSADEPDLPPAATPTWDRIRAALIARIGPTQFSHWFDGVEDSATADTLSLHFPTEYAAEWVARHLVHRIHEAAAEAGLAYTIQIVPPDATKGAAS